MKNKPNKWRRREPKSKFWDVIVKTTHKGESLGFGRDKARSNGRELGG